MKINMKKKQKLRFVPHIDIKMDDNSLKQILKFKNLGSIFTEDGKNRDIIQGIKEDNVMFNNKKQLLCSNKLSLEIKKNLTKLYLECCCLRIRNMDPKKKLRKGRKCIRNMVLEKNFKNKKER
jgi:hypothetical protein